MKRTQEIDPIDSGQWLLSFVKDNETGDVKAYIYKDFGQNDQEPGSEQRAARAAAKSLGVDVQTPNDDVQGWVVGSDNPQVIKTIMNHIRLNRTAGAAAHADILFEVDPALVFPEGFQESAVLPSKVDFQKAFDVMLEKCGLNNNTAELLSPYPPYNDSHHALDAAVQTQTYLKHGMTMAQLDREDLLAGARSHQNALNRIGANKGPSGWEKG